MQNMPEVLHVSIVRIVPPWVVRGIYLRHLLWLDVR